MLWWFWLVDQNSKIYSSLPQVCCGRPGITWLKKTIPHTHLHLPTIFHVNLGQLVPSWVFCHTDFAREHLKINGMGIFIGHSFSCQVTDSITALKGIQYTSLLVGWEKGILSVRTCDNNSGGFFQNRWWRKTKTTRLSRSA